MNTSDIIQLVLAIFTFFGILVALFNTWRSIKSQEKQSLFSIKSKNYTVLALTIKNYEKIKGQIPFDEANQLFAESLANSAVPLILGAIGREIDKKRIDTSSFFQSPVLSSYIGEMTDKIEYSMTEIPLLFSKEVADASIIFLKNYHSFIIALYGYGLIFDVEAHSASDKTLEIVNDFWSLGRIKKNLLSSYENIANNNILQKMEDEIKLQRKAKK